MIKLYNIKINTISKNYLRYLRAKSYWILTGLLQDLSLNIDSYYVRNSAMNSEVPIYLFFFKCPISIQSLFMIQPNKFFFLISDFIVSRHNLAVSVHNKTQFNFENHTFFTQIIVHFCYLHGDLWTHSTNN